MKMRHKVKRIHFIGIGGSGMSGIAEVLLNLGYQVSGSDLQQTPVTERLEELGAKIHTGHSRQHVGDVEVVVRSTAVKDENPEVVEALERSIPVIPRAEMLAELMRLKYGVAVAGTHGKTTTTSMIATMLADTDLDPTIVIGGRLNSLKSSARLGQGEIMVAEADESDGSFLYLSPIIAMITNIDREHLDHYQGGVAEIEDTFVTFANKVPFYGLVIVCLDDPRVQEIIPRISRRLCTYGFSPQADFQATKVQINGMNSSFTVVAGERVLGEVSIGLPGRHYVQNALAAIAAGFEIGLDFELIQRNLKRFSGVQRRLQILGEFQGVTVIDDYGHHPTEIIATLGALRQAFPDRKLVVAFQPHRFSRTKYLFTDFLVAFNEADELLMTAIYPAGETPIAGITAENLAAEIKHHGHKNVHYYADQGTMVSYLRDNLQGNQVLVTLGAGDINKVAYSLLAS